MKLYIGIHYSRYGNSVYPFFKEEPVKMRDEFIEFLGDDWEGEGSEANREDEYAEICGPFDVPEKA